MKREIKFRVWDATPEEDNFTGIMINHEYAMVSNYMAEAINGNYPIMQFTGLKDKNGVDIYEGDIVKCYGIDRVSKTTVTFSNGCFYTVIANSNYRLGGWIRESVEVIGNIHETPELL